MARSHGKILCRIWQDPDWRLLGARDQWAFMLLLSQPKLSLVGCIDLMPTRWAAMADGLTVEVLEVSLEALEAARFVATDRDTDELLVRSFTRNDGIPVSNPKLRKGLWGAWEAVCSAHLRQVAVDNMPAELWTFDHPLSAARMRRSGRMEQVTDSPIEHPSNSTTLLPPATYHRPPSAITRPVPESVADLTAPPMPRIPDDLATQGLARVAALRQQLHPDPHEPW